MINYNTKNLVVINFPAHAGGKLIAGTLAISENFLHQHEEFATAKMIDKWDEKYSFDVSKNVYKQKINFFDQFELNTYNLAGFNFEIEKSDQEILATDLWKTLTNQDQYYFLATNHNPHNSWQHYPQSKHIIFKNYQFVLAKRNNMLEKKWHFDLESCKDFIDFDMESLHKKSSFQKEIDKVCEYVGITIKNKKYCEQMRQLFLKTIILGYK